MGSGRGKNKRVCNHTADDDYVDFGDVARQRCGQQCQYAARYLVGWQDYPNLGEGLRYTGDINDYHGIKIHADDAEEFVRRYAAHQRQQRA